MSGEIEGLYLPDYAVELFLEVESKTRQPVVVYKEDAIGYDSELRVAGPVRPFHEIAISPGYWDYKVHFVVNALYKLWRLWEVPEKERYCPASESGRMLPLGEHFELFFKNRGLSKERFESLSRFLYEGIVRQLTSMTMDIRVERELAGFLPEHKPQQVEYLSRQVRDLEPSFNPKLLSVAPERIYAASSAMNVVLAEEAGEIAGVAPGSLITGSAYHGMGERLRELLNSVAEDGAEGDRVATDLWAKELELEDWFGWARMGELG